MEPPFFAFFGVGRYKEFRYFTEQGGFMRSKILILVVGTISVVLIFLPAVWIIHVCGNIYAVIQNVSGASGSIGSRDFWLNILLLCVAAILQIAFLFGGYSWMVFLGRDKFPFHFRMERKLKETSNN